jgi:hypothetical protein
LQWEPPLSEHAITKAEDAQIRVIVHEEMRDALRTQNKILEKQGITLDKIADSAQAQLLSNVILHGSPQMGLKGAIPDLQDRMAQLETRAERTEKIGDERHTANSGRLDALERGQHRIRRGIVNLYTWLISKSDDGKTGWTKLIAFGGGMGLVISWIVGHLPSWHAVKRFCVAIASQVSR